MLLARLRSLPDWAYALVLAAVAAISYIATGWGHPTYYDYFDPLARALREGHWWLDHTDPLLHELLPCGEGRWCAVFVPLPTFIVLPFTFFFQVGDAQRLASSLAGGLAAAPLFLALRAIGSSRRLSALLVALALWGTSLYFLSVDGRAWYFAHSTGVLFASLALWLALSGRSAWLVAVCIGLASLARVPYALAVPGLSWLCVQQGTPLKTTLLKFALGLAPLVALELGYDVLRWGIPWEKGYVDLASTEVFYPNGLFSLAYLPRHFYAIFIQAPEFVGNSFFFLKPTWAGVAVSLMSPAFVYLLPALRCLKQPRVLALVACAALVFAPDLLHGNVGWTQLGYRFWVDPLPFFLPIVAIGATRNFSKPALSLGLLLLVGWSVAITTYFTIAVRWFDYIEMRYPPL